MHHLEKEKVQDQRQKSLEQIPQAQHYQLQLFESSPALKKVQGLLHELDINTISPVEALLKLNELKILLEEK
jgi:DNA mismatch repair protein MutS